MNPIWYKCVELAEAVGRWLVASISSGSLGPASMRELTFPSVFLRLALSILLGGIIGLERAKKNRPAGFRTLMLVCMGASLAMLLGQYLALLAAAHGKAQYRVTVIIILIYNGADDALNDLQFLLHPNNRSNSVF